MEVKLMHVTPLDVLVRAIRTCYESHEKSDSLYVKGSIFPYTLGLKDKALIERIIESGHHSTLEHVNFSFEVLGMSRLCLQEWARHRIASLSVKSTRYTIKELKGESPFSEDEESFKRASEYLNFTGKVGLDNPSMRALEELRQVVNCGFYSNDEVKYIIPDCYKTNLIWSINLRSLRNFFELRLSPRAHFEIRSIARAVYHEVPQEYRFMLPELK
jgi:thymidylate synthase (FAD)